MAKVNGARHADVDEQYVRQDVALAEQLLALFASHNVRIEVHGSDARPTYTMLIPTDCDPRAHLVVALENALTITAEETVDHTQ